MLHISMSDVRWMRLATLQAESAPHPQWRVGALLVRGGSVLAAGSNRYRNHPAQVALGDVSYHAEEVVLRRAGNPQGATLYVARVTRSGLLGLARPCESCSGLLAAAGVHTVVWTHAGGMEGARLLRSGKFF